MNPNFVFIGKIVQNGDNKNSRGKVVGETGPGYNRFYKKITVLTSSDREVKMVIKSMPDNEGRYWKTSSKGFVKLIENSNE